MNKKIKINLLKDKFRNDYFLISIYNKYDFKQYILRNNILYTFFLIMNFLYKYGFVKIKKKK
jgi:hypothetical protein